MVVFFLSCSELRQRVDPRVVLSMDVLHRSFKLDDEVGDNMVVPLQQQFLHLERPFIWPTTNWESFLHVTSRNPMLYAKFRLARMASYSAWLLVAFNSNLSVCSRMMLPGPSRTTSTPHVVLLDDPSGYTIHLVERSC